MISSDAVRRVGSVSRGRDPGPAAAAAAAASRRAGFLPPDKKAERRGYMHQLFIVSNLPFALAFLLSGHMPQVFRVYVLVYLRTRCHYCFIVSCM